MQRLAIGGAVLALLLAACGGDLKPLSEGPSEATKCGYVEADKAAKQAREEYRKAERARAAKSLLEEIGRRKEAADERLEYAKECEARAREWSDLLAQQQSARAAVSSAQTAKALIPWTFLEILALFSTIGVGVWAIVENRNVAKKSLDAARESFTLERRAWMRVVRIVPMGVQFRNGGVTVNVVVRVKNVGLSPAHEVKTHAWPSMNDGVIAATETLAGEMQRGESWPFIGVISHLVFPNQKIASGVGAGLSDPLPADRTQEISILVRGYISYKIAGDAAQHHTPFLFEVLRKPQDGDFKQDIAIREIDGDLSEERLFARHAVFGSPMTAD